MSHQRDGTARPFLSGLPRMTDSVCTHCTTRCTMRHVQRANIHHLEHQSCACDSPICMRVRCARRTPGPGPSTPPPSTLDYTAQHAVQCNTRHTLNSIDGIPYELTPCLLACLMHRPINFYDQRVRNLRRVEHHRHREHLLLPGQYHK